MGKQFKSLVEKIVANKKVGWFVKILKLQKLIWLKFVRVLFKHNFKGEFG